MTDLPAVARPPRRLPFPVLTVAITLIAIGLHVWPPTAGNLFYERDAVRAGEFWRLWTGHVVHFGSSSLFWNLAVFIPSAAWCERIAPSRARFLFVFAPAFISGALFALDPALQRYGGLSGLAASTLAFLAITQLAQGTSDRWFWRTVLFFLAAKIAVELLADRPAFAGFVTPGSYTVPIAHLAGVLAAWLVHRWGRSRRNSGR